MKIRTIKQLLVKLRACPAARKKYGNDSRAFKTAFINAPWEHGQWIGSVLFSESDSRDFPRFAGSFVTWRSLVVVNGLVVGDLFRKKENRIKYWPEVRKRLKQLGVQL